MCIVMKAVDHLLDTLVDEGVIGDVVSPGLQFCFCRQFAVEKEICNFEIGALLSKLVNRIAAIFEDTFVAVDKSDSAFARCRVHKGGIVSHQAKVVRGCFYLAQVHRLDGRSEEHTSELQS